MTVKPISLQKSHRCRRLHSTAPESYARKASPASLTPFSPQDTHIHASQHPNAGIFGKTTLLDWLHTYTFPLESSLSSLHLARRVYSRCVSRTLSHGTTTASYFATLHVESTNLLADICLQKGQRAFIGRVCMDSDLSPEYIRDESPEKAIADTEATIAHINAIDPHHNLITPVITPRFAPSCTSPLLQQLGHLASTTHLPIQTHISENPSEISLVHSLFPTHTSYAHVYDAHSLLTPRTVLAHAIHLSPSERSLVKQRQSKISHCPVSNTSLSSGLCPVRELLDQGITVGLGTDVSGGYSSSILTAAREAGMVSRTVAALTPESQSQDGHKQGEKEVDGRNPDPNPATSNAEAPDADKAADQKEPRYSTSSKDRKKLSVEECLYLATRGGAACLNLSHKIGDFSVGMEWDAQLIQLSTVAPPSPPGESVDGGEIIPAVELELNDEDEGLVDLWGKETWSEKVAKWLFCGDDRNTRKVFVRGRLVYERR